MFVKPIEIPLNISEVSDSNQILTSLLSGSVHQYSLTVFTNHVFFFRVFFLMYEYCPPPQAATSVIIFCARIITKLQ